MTATTQLRAISFMVVGDPAPQGSKKHVGNGVMVESSKRVKPWRQDVKDAALTAIADWQQTHGPWTPMTGPVAARIVFVLKRPQSHYRTGTHAHVLRDDAPTYADKGDDADKLLRSTFDALTAAGIWIDDRQVARGDFKKVYTGAISGMDTRGAFLFVRQIPRVGAC
jgi:crossover junction endodeoxyribonuclease RusA